MQRSLFLLLVAFSCSVLAADTPWRVGVSSVRITPGKPVPMAGYASRTAPYDNVEHDIYAKALAIQDEYGERAVLITTDLVGIPRTIADPVCQRIQSKTGLSRSRILLSSSHTHSAPLLALEAETRYSKINPDDGRNLVAYTRSLQDKLVQVAGEALEKLQPASLSWGTGIAHFAMNRREHTPKGVILGVNPRGPVDRSLPVLRVATEDGTLMAVLFSYACHNTTLTGSNRSLCGDYAGFAQLYVQEQHPSAVALFMIGCGGDANPHPRGTMENARDHGRVLGEEVCRVLQQDLTPITGSLNCQYSDVSLPLQQFTRTELEAMAAKGPSWQRNNAKQLLGELDQEGKLPSSYLSPLSVWQFGTDLTFVGLPCEVVVDYVPLLERSLGPLRLWITAYCNDVSGYIPSKRVLEEGGYECRGLYAGPGFFAPETEDVLVRAAIDLALEAGRPLPGKSGR